MEIGVVAVLFGTGAAQLVPDHAAEWVYAEEPATELGVQERKIPRAAG